jgi:hypothetical protein
MKENGLKKLILVVMMVFALMPGIASASKGFISLWDVKVSSSTIGNLWYSMPTYQYTCKSEKVKFPSGETYNKVVFWPNFYWSDTLVSKDTVCVLTNTPNSRLLIQKWISEPMLYRHLSSNFYEGHPDLIEASQVKSFRKKDLTLVCRASVLGFYDTSYNPETESVTEFKPRFQKALFAPYTGDFSPYKVFASRDLTCTTNKVLIKSWKKNPNWTWIEMPKSN